MRAADKAVLMVFVTELNCQAILLISFTTGREKYLYAQQYSVSRSPCKEIKSLCAVSLWAVTNTSWRMLEIKQADLQTKTKPTATW